VCTICLSDFGELACLSGDEIGVSFESKLSIPASIVGFWDCLVGELTVLENDVDYCCAAAGVAQNPGIFLSLVPMLRLFLDLVKGL